ncbi:aminotransferase class V-fold PLP-dependent enzyme [Ruegeria sp. 2012CJ41-6]|uniref:Aminotransferase class V-fold PLP-dependent enzyme n=1 Tax=Ruegeria spongiae TaxID=2942209 RepID=A0ABT0Q6Z0_9RHOB|nr:aminotransferase class V-fold PLP-dependent enzyme [Ruegeria spongiae]MCL6285603.1 aminotransferase class V-fold PLP-dependent enzyme [Ruegeria spongiae]
MAEFSCIWSAPNDGQWEYVLRRRQEFVDNWRGIIGAAEGTVTTCESVTQGVHSFLRSLPEGKLKGKRVLVAANCFPSVHFLLAGLADKIGFTLDTVPLSAGKSWVETSDVIESWQSDVGFALITWISSTTSARCDLDALLAHGRDMGSLIGVDITQGAGLLPFDVSTPRVDMSVSTSLKWMCGTPGAGMLYVDPQIIPRMRPEVRGWFSQDNPFSWGLDKFAYAGDIRRFDNGTPGSVAAMASLPALKWHAAQDHTALATENRRLVDEIIAKADAIALPLNSPRDACQRGGSVMLQLSDQAEAEAIVAALKVEGYSVDFRGSILRMSPGYISHEDAIGPLFDVIVETINDRRKPSGRRAHVTL